MKMMTCSISASPGVPVGLLACTAKAFSISEGQKEPAAAVPSVAAPNRRKLRLSMEVMAFLICDVPMPQPGAVRDMNQVMRRALSTWESGKAGAVACAYAPGAQCSTGALAVVPPGV